MTDSKPLNVPDERIGSSPEVDLRNEQCLHEHAVCLALRITFPVIESMSGAVSIEILRTAFAGHRKSSGSAQAEKPWDFYNECRSHGGHPFGAVSRGCTVGGAPLRCGEVAYRARDFVARAVGLNRADCVVVG